MELTNITELIYCDAIGDLLRLCGVDEREISADASDYERFRALCHAVPLLTGHPLPCAIREALRCSLGLDLPLSPETCDDLWIACAERLATETRRRPLTLSDPDRVDWKSPDWHIRQTAWVLDGTQLLDTQTETWDAWEREMRGRMDECCRADGAVVVRFSPDTDACGVIPDRYHVEQALQKRETSPVLTAQIFRFLAAELQRRGMTLWLDTDSCGADAVSLLTYAERCVGLPDMIWTCKTPDAFAALRDWQTRPHPSQIRFAVRDGITDGELREIARAYPLGRLWKLCDPIDGNDATSVQIYECRI